MGEIVECHSDYTYAERPVALTWEGSRLEITEITAQWRTPDEKRFQVRTIDGQKFELSYREAAHETQSGKSEHGCPGILPGPGWQIHPFQEK